MIPTARPASSDAAGRVAFRPNWTARAGWTLLALYAVYAATQLGFSPSASPAASPTGSSSWPGCSRRTSPAGS